MKYARNDVVPLPSSSWFGREKKGKKWAVWRTVQSNHPVSQRRQGPGVSGVKGCGGNRKRRTPTPQEHEGSDQLAGLPPRRGGAPGWREAVGKWGGGGEGGVGGVGFKPNSTRREIFETLKELGTRSERITSLEFLFSNKKHTTGTSTLPGL